MNRYKKLKDMHTLEKNVLPFFFIGLNEEQFNAMIRSFGLQPDDLDAFYDIALSDFDEREYSWIEDMFVGYGAAMQRAIHDDETGDGFIYEMFLYELENHDFVHTNNLTDVLHELLLSADEIIANKRLLHGLRKALAKLGEGRRDELMEDSE